MTHPETERYFTPKLGIAVPSIDDEMSAMRAAWDRLDQAYSGGIVVNPGVQPDDSVLYDGAIVAERGTGIIWRAQRNNAGAFEKRYIKYPWSISLSQAATPFQSVAGGQWGPWGYQVYDGGVNSGAGDMINNRLVIPVTGIYVGRDKMYWSGVPGGHYAHTLWRNDNNGTAPTYNDWYESTWPYPSADGNNLSTVVTINEKLFKGDTVCAGIWQDSGAARSNTHNIKLSLLRLVVD